MSSKGVKNFRMLIFYIFCYKTHKKFKGNKLYYIFLFLYLEKQKDFSIFQRDSPKLNKFTTPKKGEFNEKIDFHKKNFLENLNKNAASNQQVQSSFAPHNNIINNIPLISFSLDNNLNQQNISDKLQGPIFLTKTEPHTDSLIINKVDKQNDFDSSNKVIPNKWDIIDINGNNLINIEHQNKADMITALDESENSTRKNNIDSNLDFKIENFFNNNDNNLPNNLNKNMENMNDRNMSNIDNKIINSYNFFEKPNIEMDEESLVTQLDKIDFIENSNLKLIQGKSSGSDQILNYYNTNNKFKLTNPNFESNNRNINNNNQNNIINENAIIKQIFGNETLIKNYTFSSMSICHNTNLEEFNDYVIKNETDLDLIFDMIYKSQKISLDVMYNLRNKLRVRGYNTALSLRLKEEKEKSWRFLYDDYKDISPEIEALALLIEYYLEKNIKK